MGSAVSTVREKLRAKQGLLWEEEVCSGKKRTPVLDEDACTFGESHFSPSGTWRWVRMRNLQPELGGVQVQGSLLSCDYEWGSQRVAGGWKGWVERES